MLLYKPIDGSWEGSYLPKREKSPSHFPEKLSMGSEAEIKLPVIDFSSEDLKPGTPTWNSVKCQVRTALEEFGCFKALYDKVPMELLKAIFESSREFFDLPLEIKAKCSSDILFEGHNNSQEFLEAVGLENPTSLEKVESFTEMIWPQGNSNFSQRIQSYSEKQWELDNTIRRMVLESFGLEKYMDEHIVDSIRSTIRMSKYTAGSGTNGRTVAIGDHTDKVFLSILAGNQNGLELQTKDGQWIDVNYSYNAFFVMVGDSLHAWTNGRVHAPLHRVVVLGDETRYSIGFFSNPKLDYILKAPEELVDEEHPLLFKPFTFPEYYNFYLSGACQNPQSTLKEYCGV